MRNLYLLLGQALIGLATLGSVAANAQEVWVVTNSGNPVTGKATVNRLIELDMPQRFEAELAAQLPSDPQRAAALVQQRLQQGGQPLQKRMRAAYQGVADAWSLGITTLPAVVVDQRYVVYGESDLDKALARVAQHRKDKP
ncbi:TIGR03757 family integrating conjugative element protein [Pseudomonas amygdali]|uniref:TIGR03757 family integrating conjugative element protein n=1 Tax=Pseudomonas amygdali TaxID=47877 RepID=UPI001CD8AECE|nr:TIGR03757 family integrating conjugative element protein [Pseudomonas amygdali]UBT80425.1 TIGR03757 family integrating conjugative element protein [Pseudomonas amygdali]